MKVLLPSAMALCALCGCAETDRTSAAGTREAVIFSYTSPDGHGPYEIPSYDPDNEYAAKIRAAGVSEDIYPGSVIGLTDAGWYWYYEPEDPENTEKYRFIGTPGNEDSVTEEELNAVLDEMDAVFNDFVSKADSGEITPVDLDGDGKIQYSEAIIQSFYFLADEQEKPYYGIVTFFDYNDVLWESAGE